jgi:hypothetical protein
MAGWIDADDIDLAAARVDLRPAEACKARVVLGQQEAFGIEPVFGHTPLESLAIPRALLRMLGECAVIHFDPCVFVTARFEAAKPDAFRQVRLEAQRQRHFHVQQVSPLLESEICSSLVVRVCRLEDPPMDVAAAFLGDDLERASEQGLLGAFAPLIGMNDNLETPLGAARFVMAG